MSTANDIQHGGDHYKKKQYQHWDFGCDLNLHGLIWCASKYASRWKDKAGVLDLQKAVHFLDKAIERDVAPMAFEMDEAEFDAIVARFTSQLEITEGNAVIAMVAGNYYRARDLINCLIDQATFGNEMLPA